MPRGPRVIQILRDFSILGSNIIDEIDSKINIKIYIPFVTLLMEGKIYSNFSDTCILTSVLSIIRTTFDFYILKKVACIWLPFVINHSRLIALRSTELLKRSMIQWVCLQYRTPIHKLFLRFSVNWPQLWGFLFALVWTW